MPDLTYRYRTQAIVEGMEDIRRAHNRIDDALDRLETFAESCLSEWAGDAQSQYYAHKTQWNNSVDAMRAIMTEKAIPALQRILENYHSAERINSQGWQEG